jgi:hypothetical protein
MQQDVLPCQMHQLKAVPEHAAKSSGGQMANFSPSLEGASADSKPGGPARSPPWMGAVGTGTESYHRRYGQPNAANGMEERA